MYNFVFQIVFVFSFIVSGVNFLNANTPAPLNIPILPIKDPAALIGNELTRIDDLIQATQQSLEGQLALRKKIADYKKIQESYMLHPKDNEILFRMIKSAYSTLKSIEENHLEQTFDPDFISELKVLAQVASKRGVPKP